MTGGFEAHVAHVLSTSADQHAAARSSLAASWRRSLNGYKLDPGRRQRPERLSARQVSHLREAEEAVLRAAELPLDGLITLLQAFGCAVVLADAKGQILDHRCRATEADLFADVNLVTGGDWSEAAEGTNGIGTCLREARPVIIRQTDHFAARNIAMTCLGAPIHGVDGTLAAVLDISSTRVDHSSGTNALMAEALVRAASDIELGLLRRALPKARLVLADPEQPKAGYLAVDLDDVVQGATQAARRHCGLDLTGAIQPRPLGDVLGQPGDRSDYVSAEYALLRRALLRAEGNVSAAARNLGIGRATLYRRMNRVGLEPGLVGSAEADVRT